MTTFIPWAPSGVGGAAPERSLHDSQSLVRGPGIARRQDQAGRHQTARPVACPVARPGRQARLHGRPVRPSRCGAQPGPRARRRDRLHLPRISLRCGRPVQAHSVRRPRRRDSARAESADPPRHGEIRHRVPVVGRGAGDLSGAAVDRRHPGRPARMQDPHRDLAVQLCAQHREPARQPSLGVRARLDHAGAGRAHGRHAARRRRRPDPVARHPAPSPCPVHQAGLGLRSQGPASQRDDDPGYPALQQHHLLHADRRVLFLGAAAHQPALCAHPGAAPDARFLLPRSSCS